MQKTVRGIKRSRYSKKINTVSKGRSKDFWLESHRPAQTPQLTPVMKKEKSVHVARRHRRWNLTEWKKGLFCDKCTKQQFVSRDMHIRHPLRKRFDKTNML